MSQFNDSYQPSLFLKHVDYRTQPDEIYKVLTKMDFGAVSNIYIRQPPQGKTLTTAIVNFHYWHKRDTVNTREMLFSGKFLQIHYTDRYYWKVYAFRPKQRARLGEDEETKEDKETKDEEKALLKEILEFVEKKVHEPITPEGTPPSSPRTLFEAEKLSKRQELEKTAANKDVVVASTQTIKIKFQKEKHNKCSPCFI